MGPVPEGPNTILSARPETLQAPKTQSPDRGRSKLQTAMRAFTRSRIPRGCWKSVRGRSSTATSFHALVSTILRAWLCQAVTSEISHAKNLLKSPCHRGAVGLATFGGEGGSSVAHHGSGAGCRMAGSHAKLDWLGTTGSVSRSACSVMRKQRLDCLKC